MCAGLHRLHMAFTTFHKHRFCASTKISRFSRAFPRNFFRGRLQCTEIVQAALRKSPAIFQCFRSGARNRRRLAGPRRSTGGFPPPKWCSLPAALPRAYRSDTPSAIPFLVKMEQCVVQGHPNLSTHRVHANAVRIARKYGESVSFPVVDLFARRLRLRKGIQSGKLKVQPGVTSLIVLTHQRFRAKGIAVVQPSLRIRAQATLAEKPVNFLREENSSGSPTRGRPCHSVRRRSPGALRAAC